MKDKDGILPWSAKIDQGKAFCRAAGEIPPEGGSVLTSVSTESLRHT